MCCNVVMCVVFVDGREGGKWKGLEKGALMCCCVVMCAGVTGWGRRMEMECVLERGFYVL
jgi:hypothetical protein